MWIERSAEAALLRAARTRPAVVVTGSRQTGKTSILRRLFPDYAFVSLDLPAEAEQAERDPSLFLRRYPPPVIIDEVQYAPGLFRHLKVAIDDHRKRNGQFLLTGSQKFTLMKGVADSLAGRAEVLELETLSAAEIRSARPEATTLDLMLRGGFPEIHANPDIDWVTFYNSYLATYLERDIRSLAQVGNLRDFERFLRACAFRSANLLNKADLARDVGIAPSTANLWLSMLETSGQVVLLEPWFSNRTKSIIKSPKLYFADTGVLCALLNIRAERELTAAPAVGAIWETFAFAQLRHRERKAGRRGNIFFWRDRAREVDFVVERGQEVELFEAKWTELPGESDAANLQFARAHFEERVAAATVLCRTKARYPMGKGVRVESPMELA